MTSETTVSEELVQFINAHASDYYALQLILFFADHPYAQFNELAIIHALTQDGGRRSLQEALRALVDKGMIRTCTNSNVLLYSLPENMRSLVSELAELEPRQRQPLLRPAGPHTVRKGGHLFQHVAVPLVGSRVSQQPITNVSLSF